MNQYKSRGGTDRQAYLSLWSGEPLIVDRKKNPLPLILPNPFTSVLGSLTPDMLPELGDERGRQDGFIHRILFSFPEAQGAGRYSEDEIPEEAERAWQHAVGALRQLCGRPSGDDDYFPTVVEMEPDAKAVFVKFFNGIVSDLNDSDFPYELRGPSSKLRSYALRIAVVLHELHNVFAEAPSDTVSARTMAAACDVVEYFQSHAQRVYKRLRTDPADRRVERAVLWLENHDRRASIRELVRNNVAGVNKTSEAQALARDLVDRGFAKMFEQQNPRGGPKSKIVELLGVSSDDCR